MRITSIVLALGVWVAHAQTVEIPFQSHDGHPMLGKLTVPATEGRHAVVIYVQTAEGATVDMKRPAGNRTFNYYDLYREKLPAMDVAFFSYEGRGVHMGDQPPRFETIDREVYDTSTLDNKVRDVISAVETVKRNPAIDPSRIFLMGASEGTLLSAEAASRIPDDIAGLVLYAVVATTIKDALIYQSADGAWVALRPLFDTGNNGGISPDEYAADARQYRARVMSNIAFEQLDADGDGTFTRQDFRALRKPLTDTVVNENFEGINAWLKQTSVVSLPGGWVEDHFRHAPMWSFLERIRVPVGLFHGTADNLTSIDAVKDLERRALQEGKTNLEFHYFEGLDHSLGVVEWFIRGTLPAGHQAIFEFIREKSAAGLQPR